MNNLCISVCLLFSISVFGQKKKVTAAKDTSDLTFSGTKINPYQVEFDTTGHVTFSGYVDTYYANYLDTISNEGYTKFPTIAPRDEQFGINLVQLSARYNSNDFRGTVTLFGGDCPQASWSTKLNFIQEANMGFRIVKKLWLDAGFFRTHIGLESIQPRENIAMSLATTTYFEPYFMSGAKLTWQHSERFAIQANVFNSFNQFIETNRNKALGLSMSYAPDMHSSLTFSTIVCDESPDELTYRKTRVYNNLCYTYKSTKWIAGIEANYGTQTNTGLKDTTATAFMYSALAAVKYRVTHKWAGYCRGELFSDPNEILTGPVENGLHELIGLDIIGGTVGIEYKPIANSYFRLESRYLQTKSSESIFYVNSASTNQRLEFIAGLGVWF